MRRLIALVGLLALSSGAAALPPCSPEQLLAPDGVGFAWFGCAVALDGDTMLVGAFRDSELVGSGGAAYVRRWDGSAWAPEAKLQPPDGAANDEFGYVVALDGDTAVIGSSQADGTGGADQGAVYIFVRSPGGTTWTQQAKLLASDGAAGDLFGRGVAIRGDEVIVGAPQDDGGAGADQGSAYIFTRSGVTWTQRAKLEAADAGAGDGLGRSVALGAGTALIGAPFDDGTGGIDEGAAYAFVGSGASWSQEAKLTAADNAAGDWFGRTVLLDGDRAAICALFDDGPGASNDGSVTVFTRAGGIWTQQQKLFGENGDSNDWFGYSLALSGDTLLVGRPQGDFNDANHKGGAREYRWTGSSWELARKLDPPGLAFGDYYGMAVALDGDTAVCGAGGDFVAVENQGSVWVYQRVEGEIIARDQSAQPADAAAGDGFGAWVAIDGNTSVIGAYTFDGIGGTNQGAAYVYTGSGTTWTEQAKLVADDGAMDDLFGRAVAVDGDTVLIGAASNDGPAGANQGAAYIFVRSGTTWTQQAKLIPSDAAADDEFGNSVALHGDTAVVGAERDDGPAGSNQGSCYVFVRTGSVWTQQAKLLAPDAAANDFFGSRVAFEGDTAVAGAYQDDGLAGSSQGSAHVFVRAGTVWSHQAKLEPIDAGAGDEFGRAIAIDGDAVLIGAYLDDGSGGLSQGSAYVFVRSGVAWSQQAKLEAADGETNDTFGASVALDGGAALIGAPLDNGTAGSDMGSAYVFVRAAGTLTWVQQAKVEAADGLAGNRAGAVALRGGTAAVGASFHDGSAGLNQGTVWFYCVKDECLPALVGNLTSGSAYPSLASAIAAGSAFDALSATTPSFWASGSLGLPGVPLLIDSTGGIRQPYTQTLSLGSGGSLGTASGLPAAFFGTVTMDNSLISSAGTVRNRGSLTASGSIDADLQNDQTMLVVASTEVTGDVINRGTITVESGALTILGTLTNSGTLIGDIVGGRQPSAAAQSLRGLPVGEGFEIEGDFSSDAGSTLNMPSTAARFTCGGAFDCAINDRARYDLRSAELRMNGADTPQALEAMSADIGAVLAGLDRSQPGRFPIGTLRIGPGAAAVTVVDARDNDNAGQATGEAVYVETLIIESGASLTAPTCRVYYKTLVNNGGTITTPAGVILIPPFCPGNANGDGVVDFDDITSVLASFGADYGAGTGPGDANGDHLVDFDDITSVLASFGAVCP